MNYSTHVVYARVLLATALGLSACREPSDAQRVAKLLAAPEAYAADTERECSEGVAKSCTSLGVHYAFGTYGRTVDYGMAHKLFTKSCNAGDPAGCHELGVLLEHGRGTTVDHGRARALYEKACDGGQAASCEYVGDYLASGRGGVTKDQAAASAWYAKACAAGQKSSCRK